MKSNNWLTVGFVNGQPLRGAGQPLRGAPLCFALPWHDSLMRSRQIRLFNRNGYYSGNLADLQFPNCGWWRTGGLPRALDAAHTRKSWSWTLKVDSRIVAVIEIIKENTWFSQTRIASFINWGKVSYRVVCFRLWPGKAGKMPKVVVGNAMQYGCCETSKNRCAKWRSFSPTVVSNQRGGELAFNVHCLFVWFMAFGFDGNGSTTHSTNLIIALSLARRNCDETLWALWSWNPKMAWQWWQKFLTTQGASHLQTLQLVSCSISRGWCCTIIYYTILYYTILYSTVEI